MNWNPIPCPWVRSDETMPIHVLPPDVAAKIAAGEVVERPASVVKELVENAIDAGARTIRVEARDGGRRLIRVTDDGSGIPAEEVPLAFARHATSKLTSVEDLEHITTLGFRGEALASIAAVSRLTLISRMAHYPEGTSHPAGIEIRLEGGMQVSLGPKGAPAGTTVTVENLFHNIPARLKFLKAPATEAGHIHRVVVNYALAFPELRFHLTLDQRVALQTSGNGDLYDVLVEVLGLETARQMLEISGQLPVISRQSSVISPQPPLARAASRSLPDPVPGIRDGAGSGQPGRAAPSPQPPAISVSGYVGVPSLHRGQRDRLIFFVNRRWVQDRSLAASVTQAYHTFLPVGRHPVAVINVTLDPADVDVNVHPTKSEVKFRDQHRAFSAVQKAVRSTVMAAAPVPQIGVGFGPSPAHDTGAAANEAERWRRLATAGGRTAAQLGFEAQRTLTGDETTSFQLSAEGLPLLRVVGQVAQTYIVTEGPDGLYLVDQHAAHERVLYEQIQASLASAQVPTQQLLEPLTLELAPAQAAVLDAEADTLAQVGFVIEPFGGTTYRLRAVPEILLKSDPATALSDILAELAEGAVPLSRQSDERLIVTVCKRAAVKAGQTLSLHEMQELIHNLERCSAPRTCPHGRPTMLHLSAAQLAREFGRR
jgi:DNA mismatch repair protein MutL